MPEPGSILGHPSLKNPLKGNPCYDIAMISFTEFDYQMMRRALELARQGEGLVEPNPMVGCVIARNGQVLGEGWHQRFGAPHAEVDALANATGEVRGSTVYVTLEPCCHHGKTPPCSAALIRAQVAKVVAPQADPFPRVAGGGFAQLREAQIEVATGLLQAEAADLNAPYFKLQRIGQPWVIAKWAMTLDGKIATASGESQWISGETSRQWVHQLRGRVDGILVGRGTVEADDPLLTARPAGLRTATRIVLDRRAQLRSSSRLVQSVAETPVLVVATPAASDEDIVRLHAAGCDVWISPAEEKADAELLHELLRELGTRGMTNLLVEGGGQVLGSFLAADAIDEVHVFVAPKMIGGEKAPGPVLGAGISQLDRALSFANLRVEPSGDDWHLSGRRAIE